MQEVFTTPYFCAEQQTRWYEAVERIPDGPTVKLMQDVAKQHGMKRVDAGGPTQSWRDRTSGS